MTNPTRQQIIDAHDALDDMLQRILSSSGRWSSKERDQILAALPPRPRPTMAEVEWDDDKHRFAEAEHLDHGEVIMFNVSQVSGKVRILFNRYGEFYMGYTSPENLTPTGRRYTLTEVQE